MLDIVVFCNQHADGFLMQTRAAKAFLVRKTTTLRRLTQLALDA